MDYQEIRVGIDVGGTHTKAVALDNRTHKILSSSLVMTTHDHELGVAAGIIQAFDSVLIHNKLIRKGSSLSLIAQHKRPTHY